MTSQPTPTSTATQPPAGCTATVSVNSWSGGFVADVSVAGSNANGWTVRINLPTDATITNAWNANRGGDTGTVTFTNVNDNNRLPATLGFQANGSSTVTVTSCAVT